MSKLGMSMFSLASKYVLVAFPDGLQHISYEQKLFLASTGISWVWRERAGALGTMGGGVLEADYWVASSSGGAPVHGASGGSRPLCGEWGAGRFVPTVPSQVGEPGVTALCHKQCKTVAFMFSPERAGSFVPLRGCNIILWGEPGSGVVTSLPRMPGQCGTPRLAPPF